MEKTKKNPQSVSINRRVIAIAHSAIYHKSVPVSQEYSSQQPKAPTPQQSSFSSKRLSTSVDDFDRHKNFQ